jgi:hypothetical protein
VRDIGSRFDPPGLDLEPIPMTLVDDLVVQVEQSIDSVIPMHDLGYQRMIKFASPVTTGTGKIRFR